MYQIVRIAAINEVKVNRLIQEIHVAIALLKGYTHAEIVTKLNVSKTMVKDAGSILRSLVREVLEIERPVLAGMTEDPYEYDRVSRFRKDNVFWIQKLEAVLAQIQELGLTCGPQPTEIPLLHIDIFERVVHPKIPLTALEKQYDMSGRAISTIAYEVGDWLYKNFLTEKGRDVVRNLPMRYYGQKAYDFWSGVIQEYRRVHRLEIKEVVLPIHAELRDALICAGYASAEDLTKLQKVIEFRQRALAAQDNEDMTKH